MAGKEAAAGLQTTQGLALTALLAPSQAAAGVVVVVALLQAARVAMAALVLADSGITHDYIRTCP